MYPRIRVPTTSTRISVSQRPVSFTDKFNIVSTFPAIHQFDRAELSFTVSIVKKKKLTEK